MELKLEDIFREYPESLKSAHILRSYLTDLFPHEEKLKINLIVNAYEQNVVQEIEKAEELDSYIAKLLCSRLISNYGISSDNAEWAVGYWLLAYGKNVLHKTISVPIRKMEGETDKKIERIRKENECGEEEDKKQEYQIDSQYEEWNLHDLEEDKEQEYQKACRYQENQWYELAEDVFQKLGKYKDCADRARKCKKQAEEQRQNEEAERRRKTEEEQRLREVAENQPKEVIEDTKPSSEKKTDTKSGIKDWIAFIIWAGVLVAGIKVAIYLVNTYMTVPVYYSGIGFVGFCIGICIFGVIFGAVIPLCVLGALKIDSKGKVDTVLVFGFGALGPALLIVAWSAFAGFCGLHFTSDYLNIMEMMENEQMSQALEVWDEKGAEAFDGEEMNEIAECYYSGYIVTQDYAQAVKWYTRAAEAGNDMGMNNLGYCYDAGVGVEQDYAEAVKWYKKAAEAGNDMGMYNLGNCYYAGNGVKQDYMEAVKWYKKAAEAGNDMSMYNLGYCYDTGVGVEQDYTEAVRWYKKAAEAGNDMSMYNLGNCYYAGVGVEQDYTEAVKWYKKAAEAGNANAKEMLDQLGVAVD